jgi:hypothetical protein
MNIFSKLWDKLFKSTEYCYTVRYRKNGITWSGAMWGTDADDVAKNLSDSKHYDLDGNCESGVQILEISNPIK